ncbi:M20/M25/M40 family metallo-hydrolase [Xanthovirga aplysinae]|uniref:M20/M25/M40 family metallo-hydrolase n=1 Tax=Xanthovirga aplysinae TaxID=2529853 RepID=UPI0012BCF397|nr:M20/M25/M40 family metallo-hydrolase [Xanthovirga aplysinae]MTI32367.1 M20/M25/M40 family metallo-hydrolase [Xanthovirga aplysinae]
MGDLYFRCQWRVLSVFWLGFLFSLQSYGQGMDQDRLNILSEKYAKKSLPLLREFLSIPNDAFFPKDIEKNVKWCEQAFQSRNFKTSRIETETVPLLLAERKNVGAKKTVLIYLQIDGQPVDASEWFQESPYLPVVKRQNTEGEWEEVSRDQWEHFEKDWRVFARSASDAKGPVVMFLSALDAIQEAQIDPNFNMKVIMDFEEELGSPHLAKAVKENEKLLKADMLIIFDGPRHISNQPTLTFGARGIATISLITYGPIKPQHSGHYGNYAPNPAFGLSKLLASMKDDQGRVSIPTFYDGVFIDAETEKILRAIPDDEYEIKERLQLGRVDKVGDYYQEALQYPSLNICGMQSGWINEKKRTIVPDWAKAELDMRLVLETDPERLIGLVKKHIEDQGYYVTDKTPTKEERMNHEKVATFLSEISYQSFRTRFDSEVGVWLQKALIKAFNQKPIMQRMTGGSIPISPFITALGISAVGVPTVNRDNNQHSPNENLRLGNYRDGIKTMIAILSERL